MTMKMTARARVEKGAAVLDRAMPLWETLIDLRKLSIADGIDCVLGQLYGTYGNGLAQISTMMDSGSQDLGFISYHGQQPSIRTLTTAWKELIRERLEAGRGHDKVAEDRMVSPLRQPGDGEPASGEG